MKTTSLSYSDDTPSACGGVVYYSKAEKLHKRALIIQKKALGFYSSAVDTSLNNLAHAYMKLEKYNDALRVRMQSLKILEKLGKPENALWHPFYMTWAGYITIKEII